MFRTSKQLKFFILTTLIGLFSPTLSLCEKLPVLTEASAVRELSSKAAQLGYPVHLKGYVTYHDPDWQILYFQDAGSGISVELDQRNNALKPGHFVEIEGKSAPGSFFPIVSKASVRILGEKPLPPAMIASLPKLDLYRDESRRVQVKCIVHNAYQEAQYAILEAYDGNKKIRIRIRDYSQAAANNLIDALVQVEGVLGVTTNSAHQPIGIDLWIPKDSPISILEPPQSASTAQMPVIPISALVDSWENAPPRHRIRIQGKVMSGNSENTLLVQDSTGVISAQALFSRPISPGDSVDLVGFADPGSPVPRIIDAIYLRIKALAIESKEEKGLSVLTRIKQIRQLGPGEAGRGYPIRVRGVITYYNPQLSMLFIQDDSDAIYIQSFDTTMILQEGHEYEVEGFTAPGDFSPIITKPKFHLIGKASMPAALDVSLDQLSTGEYDCLRVQVHGIVRAVQPVATRWQLDIFNSGKRIQVFLPNAPDSAHIQSLQDAKIQARGICSIQISSMGSITGFRLNVSSIEGIQVVEQARFDPFSAPLRAIRDIFRYSNQMEMGHRVRIQGTLLHQQPGRALYIKDETGCISIQTKEMLPVSSSDLLTISGYPIAGEFAPSMEDALIKRMGAGRPSEPRILPDASALYNNYQGDLVQIHAKLIDQWHTFEGHGFILQDNSHTPFEAFLEDNSSRIATSDFRNGSELELTGIYLMRAGAQKNGLQLLLRTADDIRIVKVAPWWTTRLIFWAFGILFSLILAASAWASMLKIRVNRQTRMIQSRLEAEAALEKKYRELFEKSNDIVFACDRNAKLKSINPAGINILGYDRHELAEMELTRLVAPASLEQVHEWMRLKMKGKECPVLECELLAKDGRHIVVEVNGEIFLSEGQPTGAQGIARDITERKLAEEALHQSEEKLRQGQKLESIGKLAGGIAHDFNNILSSILGYAELSHLDLEHDHPVQSYTEQITKAGKRARELVQQILAFSRKLEKEKIPLHLQAIIKEALKLLRPTLPSTISIETDISSEHNVVLADPTQIHQVILNLATNAAHAMRAEGGVLHIGLESIHLDRNNPNLPPELSPGEYFCLSVRDTGTGMTPETQKRIFEPYFTTKPVGEGSGLGLAVVHGIIQSHNGVIAVESALGIGTCFRVFLPCCPQKPAGSKAPAQEAAKGHGNILLVDDEETVVDLCRRSLERLGYTVYGETRSTQALKKFAENPMYFDLVLTDQTMPQLTGIALAQEIWKIRPNLPVIICTGFSEQITPEKIAEMGFSALLNKPYTTTELARTIQRCLQRTDYSPL